MSLDDWLKNGWLKRHATSSREIADLLDLADRDIQTSQLPGLSLDWKHNIAYNAALQSATAALAASGYRTEREAHHYRTILSLEETVGLDSDFVAQLNTARTKRSVADYTRAGSISQPEADEMVELAKRLNDLVVEWLKMNHPDLLG